MPRKKVENKKETKTTKTTARTSKPTPKTTPKTSKTTPKTTAKPTKTPRGKRGGGFFDNLFGIKNEEKPQPAQEKPQPAQEQPQPAQEQPQSAQPQPAQPQPAQEQPAQSQSQQKLSKDNDSMTKTLTKKNTNITALRVGNPGSIYLKFKLYKNDCLFTTPGSLIYMRGNVDKGSVKFDGIGKAFWRSLSGQDALLTSYIGCEKGGEIALGIDIPNDVLELTINPTEEWVISRGSYLCSTGNINISSITKSQGVFGLFGSGEGFILPLIQTNDTVGKFWLTCYGTFEKIELKDKEEIIIDNGYFLACNKKMDYTIEKMGKTMTSTFLGGEGYGMKFIGPGTIYTQSKNLSNFMGIISNKIN